jgi:hypothetical protein
MAERRRTFLALVVFFATVLLFLSFWVVRQNRGKPDVSLRIRNVTISTELDDRLRLTGAISRFPYGSRQVFLRFDYGLARDAEVRVHWYTGDKLVLAEGYVLPAPSGSRVYCLVLENGQPLPKGLYSIEILHATERFPNFKFESY